MERDQSLVRPTAVAEQVLLVSNAQAGSYEGDFEKICRKVAPDAVCGSISDIPRRHWNTIVACGGDGTVRLVVNAMIAAKSEAALGIVPLGTANIVSRVFDIPEDPEEALKIALKPNERLVDVGLCHDEAFLLGCGLGLAERFVTTVGHEEKKKLGPFAYVRRFIEERNAPGVEFQIESAGNERVLSGVGLVIANVAQMGPRIRPFGEDEVSVDDGHLSLILLRRSGLWDMTRIGMKSLFGRAAEDSALELIPIGKCRISSRPKVPIQIDGDSVEQDSPFNFDLLPKRLRVHVA